MFCQFNIFEVESNKGLFKQLFFPFHRDTASGGTFMLTELVYVKYFISFKHIVIGRKTIDVYQFFLFHIYINTGKHTQTQT